MTPVPRASHLCAPGRLNPEPRSSDPTPTPRRLWPSLPPCPSCWGTGSGYECPHNGEDLHVGLRLPQVRGRGHSETEGGGGPGTALGVGTGKPCAWGPGTQL